MTVDRIENGTAVIDDNGKRVEIPLSELPEGTREGSLLQRKNGELFLDFEAAQKQRKELAKKTDTLFKKGK